jgi:hypothetical protein
VLRYSTMETETEDAWRVLDLDGEEAGVVGTFADRHEANRRSMLLNSLHTIVGELGFIEAAALDEGDEHFRDVCDLIETVGTLHASLGACS